MVTRVRCLLRREQDFSNRNLLTAYPGKDVAIFGDEAVDPRGDNGQRYRAELEHSTVESADVEFETRTLAICLLCR